MIVWKLIVYHQIFVSATGTSYKVVSTLCQKWVLKDLACLSKRWNFVHFKRYDLVQISPACSPNAYQIKNGETRLAVLAFATVAWESFKGKFTAKIGFSIGYFRLPLLTLTLEVWGLSIHYLISIWTTCWWNLDKNAWYKIYKILSFLAKKCLPLLK